MQMVSAAAADKDLQHLHQTGRPVNSLLSSLATQRLMFFIGAKDRNK